MKKINAFLFILIFSLSSEAISQSFPSDWKWKIGFNYSGSKSYRVDGADTYEESHTISPYSSDTIGYKYREEHETYVNCYGVDLERNFKRPFSLRTGIFINSYGKKGSFTDHHYYWASNGKVYRTVFCYISIPLNFSYNYFHNKFFRGFISAGIEINYLKWSRNWGYWWDNDPYTHGYDEPDFHLYRYQKNSYDGLNKFNSTLNLSTGIDLKIYNNVFLRFEPTFNLLLKPIRKEGVKKYPLKEINEKYYRFGLNIGLNFILKSKKTKQESISN